MTPRYNLIQLPKTAPKSTLTDGPKTGVHFMEHASGSLVDDGVEIAATLQVGSEFEHFLIRRLLGT